MQPFLSVYVFPLDRGNSRQGFFLIRRSYIFRINSYLYLEINSTAVSIGVIGSLHRPGLVIKVAQAS
jgi:hypothetical protein